MKDWRVTYADFVEKYAGKNGLDPILVEAVIWQESMGNPLAVRHEPRWKYWVVWSSGKPFRGSLVDFPHPPGVSRATEKACQAMSWGLTQVMGGVAREIGYLGQFLTGLLDPETNIQFGCEFLARCIRERSGDVRLGLVRWNGSVEYPDKVFWKMDSLRSFNERNVRRA
jgi:hypothetical protein